MVICSFITKEIDGLIKVKGVYHGIPFCLKKIVILQIPISLITLVLPKAPCAPRYKEGVARDTQPVRPGGVGRRGAVVAEERQQAADRR